MPLLLSKFDSLTDVLCKRQALASVLNVLAMSPLPLWRLSGLFFVRKVQGWSLPIILAGMPRMF